MVDDDAHPNTVTLTAAVTGIEKSLLDLCDDLLDVPVRPDDDFFELGVDSLAVAELFHAVDERLQVRIPLRAAAEHPSVRALARWVATNAPDDASARSLIRMSRRAGGRRFFCVHGIGGHVLVFGPLARRLEDDVDFYAFEATGRSDAARGDTTIEAMAERYVRDMRRVQPAGPYAVGGYSMGGVVALEMAHQLQQQGEHVDLVAMLDTTVRPPSLVGVRARALEFVSRALGVYPPVTAPYDSLEEGAHELARRIEGGIDPSDLVHFAEIYLANGEAWSGYEPPTYEGDVLLFYTNAGSNSPIPEPAEPERAADVLGWTAYVDPAHIQVVPLPGDHWTMLAGDVDHLVVPLQKALQLTRV